MQVSFSEVDDTNITRVAQLVGKTNQFNLTSRRRSQAEIQALRDDPSWHSQVVRLSDRFADHGIIGVLLAHHDGNRLEVDTWLMSCRVIGRTVENEMMRTLIRHAEQLGCTRVTGSYIPSAKNVQVADLYERLGFTRAIRDQAIRDAAEQDGSTQWALEVPGSGPAPGLMTHEHSEDKRTQ